MRIIERAAAIVCLVLTAAILGTLAYWQWIEAPAPLVTFEWSKTDRSTYHAGDTMTITRRMCFHGNKLYPFGVTRSFVDHIVYQLADFQATPPTLGCSDRSIDIEIPPSLPPGVYLYRVTGHFHINPLRQKERFEFPDLPPITVLAKDAP